MHPWRRSLSSPAAWLPAAVLCALVLGDSVLLSEGFFLNFSGAPALVPRRAAPPEACSLWRPPPAAGVSFRQVHGGRILGLRAAGDGGGFEAFYEEQKKLAKQGKAGGLAVGDVVTDDGKSWTVTAVLRREGGVAVRSYEAVEEGSRERVLVKVRVLFKLSWKHLLLDAVHVTIL